MSIATVCTLVLLFYWVPFAVGAYFTDVYPHRERRSPDERVRPASHVGSHRPVAPAY